ncbi:MAG: SAM-dependent methyltransferase [Clostridiales bacterium]|nr:SAM-dependent methyltransferase [Clostridiales bacterium]
MAKKKLSEEIQGTEKEFLDLFGQLCYSRSAWQVWADLMSAIACTLSNVTEKNPERREAREKEYESCIKRLGGSNEIPAHLFAIITIALDKNPEQDFLGKMYMSLNLGNHWKGQFFTPYDICTLMSEITVGSEAVAEAKTRDYISVNDPACGAGATLIAAANTFKRHHINYQQKVLFVGQDIDRVVAQMCYIQLSLLGCPGYIAVANTISNPITGSTLEPDEGKDQEFWYTPFYWTDIWVMRRTLQRVRNLTSLLAVDAQKQKEEEYVFFFDFNKEESTWVK